MTQLQRNKEKLINKDSLANHFHVSKFSDNEYMKRRNIIQNYKQKNSLTCTCRLYSKQTLDSKRAISERRRSPSLSNDFILLASLFSFSLSNFISPCCRLLISFCSNKLHSSSFIYCSFLVRDDSSSCHCKPSNRHKPSR